MYRYVPTVFYIPFSGLNWHAAPKSINLTCKFFSIKMFSGLMSRWQMLYLWQYWSVYKIYLITNCVSFSEKYYLLRIWFKRSVPSLNSVTKYNSFFSTRISITLMILGWSSFFNSSSSFAKVRTCYLSIKPLAVLTSWSFSYLTARIIPVDFSYAL